MDPSCRTHCCATWSPDGQWILTGNNYGGCQQWDAATGLRLDYDHLYPACDLLALATLPNGRYMVTGGEDGYALLGDLSGAWTKRAFGKHVGPVQAVAVSRYGTRVVTGGEDGIAYLWDSGILPPTRFEESQTLTIESDGSFWAMVFDYTTSEIFDSVNATGSGSLSYTMQTDHWIGAYIYDYTGGAYARGLYGLRQELSP